MLQVASVGGGLSSTLMLPRYLVRTYGRDNCRFVMCRLPNEHPDVWRLVHAVENKLGIEVEMIGQNLSPLELFEKSNFLGTSRYDICSRILKRESFATWLEDTCNRENTVLNVGITAHEIDRMISITQNYTRKGWRVEAPLSHDPAITRESMIEECREYLGFVPEMYLLGFRHHNCHGACIKAGKKEWYRLYLIYPEVFRQWEEGELKLREQTGKNVSIMREMVRGEKVQATLRELRLRWETNPPRLKDLDSTPTCFYCSAV